MSVLRAFISVCMFSLMACSGSDFSGVGGASNGPDKDENLAANPGGDSNVENGGLFDVSSIKCGLLDSSKSTLKGDLHKTEFFHKMAAVDPHGSNNDPSTGNGWNLPPANIEPNSALNKKSFKISNAQLRILSEKAGAELEVMVFAHQFARGLDRIKIEASAGGEAFSDVSATNIYSAYGYLSISNISMSNNRPVGDLEIFTFNYDPNLSGPLYSELAKNPSVRDGTDGIIPASVHDTPSVSEKGIDLSNLKIDVTIDAALYDSVQYRAIRVSAWSRDPLNFENDCVD